MEFVEGQTTESYVARFGPMPLRPALRIAWQVSKALVAAARQQVVHGDIKPANIMIVADTDEGDWPFVKLLIDFGLVRSALIPDADGAKPAGPLAGAQSGRPGQTTEVKPDARLDIYSLGWTLWYLITGEAPFVRPLTGDFAQRPGTQTPWACKVWSLLTDEEPHAGLPTGGSMQEFGSDPPWAKLEPFPKQIRRLLKRMLRKEPAHRATSPLQLQREIEQCLVGVERREAFNARIALPLQVSRQWLLVAPWTRRAAIFCAPVMGLMLAVGYYWNSDPPRGSAPASQASDVVQTQDFADSAQWLGREIPAWSYLGGWDEAFQFLALAPRLSFAESLPADPGIVGAKRWLHGDSVWDGGVADSWSGKGEGRFSVALASDYSFAFVETEEKKAAMRKGSVRAKSEVKKTTKRSAYSKYARKSSRRVSSRAKEGFNPLSVVQRAREHIRRVMRRIL
jgi:hypothetical protein